MPPPNENLTAETNRTIERILEVLSTGAAMSGEEIARAAGVTRQTVARHLTTLGGDVTTSGHRKAYGQGRRAVTYRLSRTAGVLIGVDFGCGTIRVALGDECGDL